MRVAVFGAGYAGLGVARRLDRSLPPEDDLVVVDDSGSHVVRHLLHRAIRRPEVAEAITLSLSSLLDRATVRTARVADIDPDAGEATLADGGSVEYDLGAVCLGAEPAVSGIDGVADHAVTFHRPGDAWTVRAAAIDAFDAGGRIVVGGGGLTGVQVAGELAALAAERDATERTEITVVEQAGAVPPGHDPRLQRAVTEALTAAGVTVRPSTTITGVRSDRVLVATGEPIGYDCLVWAGGITGPGPLGGDRPTVPATLRVAADTFALGDAARVIDRDGRAVPATAQAAIGEASVAAANVRDLLDHRRSGGGGFEPRLARYRHEDAGWAISVGDEAVASVGPTVLTGPAAVGVKTSVGAGYLSRIGAVREAVEHVRHAVIGE